MLNMARRVSAANRGRTLEIAVEYANAHYRARGIAMVQKVATPTKVVSGRRGETKVIRTQSTVDYIGTWGGRALAFDAKQTRERRFPMAWLKRHQFEFLRDFQQAGGISFLLVETATGTSAAAVHLIPWPALDRYWCRWTAGGQASIGSDELDRLPRVGARQGCALDYIAALEGFIR